MRDFNLATLALVALACAAGLTRLPLLWTSVNLALTATVLGMLIARQKLAGLDLARTLTIVLTALVANAIVATLSYAAGYGLWMVVATLAA